MAIQIIIIIIIISILFPAFQLFGKIKIILLFWEFFTPALANGFPLGSEWQQVSTSLEESSWYSVDVHNAVVWVVSNHLLISKFSSPFTKPLVILLSAPITIGITVTFMFHSFFSSLVRSTYLFLFSFAFSFTLWSPRTTKSSIRQVLFFLLTITWSGCLAKTGWSVCISKSQRILCVSFSRTDSGLCIYHLFIWSNLYFLYNSHWITFPFVIIIIRTLLSIQVDCCGLGCLNSSSDLQFFQFILQVLGDHSQISNYNWNKINRSGKETRRTGDQKKTWNHPNCSSLKIK